MKRKAKKKASVRVTHKLVRNLTKDEYKQVRRLGFHEGYIRDEVRDCYKDNIKAKAVMAKDKSGRIRSWALLSWRKSWNPSELRDVPDVMYWTQYRYRRMGLGAKVAKVVAKLTNNEYTHHAYQEPDFFKAIKAPT